MAVPAGQVLFTVMMLTVPSRMKGTMVALYEKLLSQVGDDASVELLCLLDNKSMTIGEKRQALLHAARGRWIAFLDDDDDVSDDYIGEITRALRERPADVITFEQHCLFNGEEFHVSFGLHHPHDLIRRREDGRFVDLKRPPYPMCVWAADIAKSVPFKAMSYGEDADWCARVLPMARTETHIDKVLHHYRFDERSSESLAFAPGRSK